MCNNCCTLRESGSISKERSSILLHSGMPWTIPHMLETCPSVQNTFCFGHFTQFFFLSFPVCLFARDSLSHCGVIGQFSVIGHSAAIKSPLGVETAAACSLILGNTARKKSLYSHLQLQDTLWICNIPSCVKDLQHFLQHAWKGKTGG